MVLIVPKVHQKDINGCLPACIKMVLDYYIQTGKTPNMEELTIDEIRRKARIKKLEGGHYSMMNINDCETFNNNFLSKFGLTLNVFGDQNIQNISKLINDDKPPILIYNVPTYLNKIGFEMEQRTDKHCLVVRDLNITQNKIIINDPEKILDLFNEFDLSALIESWRFTGSILLWIDYPYTKPITEWFKGEKSA